MRRSLLAFSPFRLLFVITFSLLFGLKRLFGVNSLLQRSA